MTTKVSWRCQYNSKQVVHTAYPPVDPLSRTTHRVAIAEDQQRPNAHDFVFSRKVIDEESADRSGPRRSQAVA